MPFILQANSSNQLTVYPEFGYKFRQKKVEERKRTWSSDEFIYNYSAYKMFDVPVSFVNSSFKAVVNSWWGANTILQWYEVGTTDVSTVRVVGNQTPIDQLIKPYDDLFKGTIKLEGTAGV